MPQMTTLHLDRAAVLLLLCELHARSTYGTAAQPLIARHHHRATPVPDACASSYHRRPRPSPCLLVGAFPK